jgi:hypothetical protein
MRSAGIISTSTISQRDYRHIFSCSTCRRRSCGRRISLATVELVNVVEMVNVVEHVAQALLVYVLCLQRVAIGPNLLQRRVPVERGLERRGLVAALAVLHEDLPDAQPQIALVLEHQLAHLPRMLVLMPMLMFHVCVCVRATLAHFGAKSTGACLPAGAVSCRRTHTHTCARTCTRTCTRTWTWTWTWTWAWAHAYVYTCICISAPPGRARGWTRRWRASSGLWGSLLWSCPPAAACPTCTSSWKRRHHQASVDPPPPSPPPRCPLAQRHVLPRAHVALLRASRPAGPPRPGCVQARDGMARDGHLPYPHI